MHLLQKMSEKETYPRRSSRQVKVVLKCLPDKKSSKDSVARFRAKIAKDPEKHEQYRLNVNDRKRALFHSMTPEQRENHRLRCKRNQKAYRARQQAQKTTESVVISVVTRHETKALEQKRAKQAVYMRTYRCNLSRQKRQAINKKRMDRYYASKGNSSQPNSATAASPQGLALMPSSPESGVKMGQIPPISSSVGCSPSTPPAESSMQAVWPGLENILSVDQTTPNPSADQGSMAHPVQDKARNIISSADETFPNPLVAQGSMAHPVQDKPKKATVTKGALKKARYRVRKALGGAERAASVLKGIIKSANKVTKTAFRKLHITADTPKKTNKKNKANQKKTRCKAARKLFRKQTPPKAKSKSTSISNFFKEHSIPLPHKRTVCSKTHKEKRVLDTPVRKLYKQFLEQNPQIQISKSTFYRHRPRRVLLHTKFPLITCLCDICQNVHLKLKVLNKFLPSDFQMADKWDFYSRLLCVCEDGQYHPVCIASTCTACGPEVLRDQLLSALGTLQGRFVVWKKWESVQEKGKTRKVLQEVAGSLNRLVRDLAEESRLNKFTSHVFTAKWQRDQFHMLCTSVPTDTAVLVVDYAENYRCIVQGEIQSAYYYYNQITVHPCVTYYTCQECGERVNDYSIFLSDDVKHDAHFSHHCQQTVFSALKSKGIKKVYIFSDGASSQFKSKVPFAYLTELSKDMDIERCYFGSRHGKNPCDAAGGIVKSFAETSVKCGHAHIQSASDFYQYCSENLSLTSTCTRHVSRTFFLVDNVDRHADIPRISTLPGTRKLHSIKHIAGTAFSTRNLSCFCETCLSSSASPRECKNSKYVKEWKTVKLMDRRESNDEQCSGDGNLDTDFIDDAEGDNMADRTVTHNLDLPFLHSDRVTFFKHLQKHLAKCKTFSELASLCQCVFPHLERFSLQPNVVSVHSSDASVDVHACLLKPDAFPHLFPMETTGDGNCMPRAVSQACFGTETFHCELRCRVVIEMCLHRQYYLSFLPQHDLIHIALLSPCSEGFDLSDFSCTGDIFDAEVLYTSTLTRTLGLWQMAAFASVIGCRIISVYPALGPHLYRDLFNKCLKPRVQHHEQSLSMLWTSNRDDMTSEYWVANHVVPLLPISDRISVVSEETLV